MSKVSKATAKKEEFGPVTDCNAEVDGYRIGLGGEVAEFLLVRGRRG